LASVAHGADPNRKEFHRAAERSRRERQVLVLVDWTLESDIIRAGKVNGAMPGAGDGFPTECAKAPTILVHAESWEVPQTEQHPSRSKALLARNAAK
jgi:hypothetical protein